MKKLVLAIGFALVANFSLAQGKMRGDIRVAIDLVNVKDDKVQVTVTPPPLNSDKLVYHIPKIVPGTYSADDYGKFVENLTAVDKKGKALAVNRNDDNSWTITGAKNIDKITYWVNDTFDIEAQHSIFSPAGTNISPDNYMLNLHGFVGYFADLKERPYTLTVTHPADLWGATAVEDQDPSDTVDLFTYNRYFEVGDNPIMYSKPNYTSFTVEGMEILFSVYSPNGVFDAKTLSPDIERMMRAQKKFLGQINQNKKYAILLYLSDLQRADANGFGALEHHTSTTVVFPEMMPKDQLIQGLIDVVSHEFFHTVTPLSIHSKEIHYFDYNNPKMSQHLWMYEGVTEYFANLFQVNQGLISEDEFYQRIAGKIENASRMNDTMPFTKMSANVLEEPYKSQYLNVYEKGALIAMCMDIIIREKSNGERGILDMMKKLSAEFGMDRPFEDHELFPKIVEITYPEVGEFLNKHVAGDQPIPYAEYFAKMGVSKAKKKVPANVFLNGETPFVTVKPGTRNIMVVPDQELNSFMKTLKMKGGDVIEEINGTAYTLDNIYDLIMASMEWKEGDNIIVKVNRGGKTLTLKGKIKVDFDEVDGWTATDKSRDALRLAWLKG